MRNRIITVAAIGLLALGIWLGTKFKGPGLGGSGVTTNPAVNVRPPASSERPAADIVGDETAPPAAASSERSSTEPGLPAKALAVLIDGDHYFIGGDVQGGDWQPATLEQIVTLAQKVPGDDPWIRVRILRRATAQVGTQNDLYDALLKAGIRKDEIQQTHDFVP